MSDTASTPGQQPDEGRVTTEVVDRVLLIGLDRPAKKNALTPEMFAQISEAYARYAADDDLRCAVLYGEGAVFSAGADLTRLASLTESGLSYGPDEYDPFGTEGARLTKPLISAVHGMCFAGGLELALASDFIIAAEGTVIGQPEVARGLFAFGGGAARWGDRVGSGNAMRYLLTGELLDAREAYRIGLVQEVVPVDGLKDRAMALASVIAANAPLGVRDTLEVGRIVHDRGLQAGLDEISPRRDQILRSQDAHEGLVSFTERRPANYVGK